MTDNPKTNPFSFDDEKQHGTNRSSPPTDCPTCGGDRFVLYSTRPVQASMWMREKGIAPPPDAATEEYAPCPSCNDSDASYWAGGKKHTPPDPAQVRERLGL